MVTKKKKERKKETSEWSYCKGLSAHLLSINWIQCIVRKLWGLLVQELLLPYLLEGGHEVSRRCPSKGPFPRSPTCKGFLRAEGTLSHYRPGAPWDSRTCPETDSLVIFGYLCPVMR